jgi:glycosyltransferase involved in cell wall biosynthesis
VKVAIFHDFFSTVGGGEKVVMAIADCLNAEIYTTETRVPDWFDPQSRIHSIGSLSNRQFIKQMGAAFRFMQTDLSDQYDLFIFSGNWAHHASRKNQPSLFYCHTPMRALYDLYPIFKSRLPRFVRPAYATWAHVMRCMDQRSVRRIDRIIANSQTVQERIREYYHRDAQVIYPPVDVSLYSCREYGDFWLSVNRLYPEKRIDLQIEAFSRMPEQNLVIVGGMGTGDHAASYAQKIFEMAGCCKNVSILGQVSDDELLTLYSKCKGLICTAMTEDFGITPLEAMASGKPVVAVNEGGLRETVTPECGAFVRPFVEDIISAVNQVSECPEAYKEACLDRATLFDIRIFHEKIFNVAHETYNEFNRT